MKVFRFFFEAVAGSVWGFFTSIGALVFFSFVALWVLALAVNQPLLALAIVLLVMARRVYR